MCSRMIESVWLALPVFDQLGRVSRLASRMFLAPLVVACWVAAPLSEPSASSWSGIAALALLIATFAVVNVAPLRMTRTIPAARAIRAHTADFPRLPCCAAVTVMALPKSAGRTLADHVE